MYERDIPQSFIRDQARASEAKDLREWIADLKVARSHRLLEIGAGKGVVINHLADSGLEAIGIDTRNVFGGIGRFTIADGRSMPFTESSFDIAFEHLVFDEIGWFSDNCIKDITRILQETKRVLRPGGYFISKYFGSMASFTRVMAELNFRFVASEKKTAGLWQHFTWKKLPTL